MLNAIFKELHRGQGIYWHGRDGYGDETNAWCRTIAEARSRIDARIAAELAARKPHELWWDTLSHEERHKWRRAMNAADTELSASEYGYLNRVS